MLFPAQWHLIEKYDLMTGDRRNPQSITAMRVGERQRTYLFDYSTVESVQVRAQNSPLRPGEHQWLLIAKHESLSCLPVAFRFCRSPSFSFLLLRTDEEYAMAKLAFSFTETDAGIAPDQWFDEGLVKVS
jgi:hypothetical protein